MLTSPPRPGLREPLRTQRPRRIAGLFALCLLGCQGEEAPRQADTPAPASTASASASASASAAYDHITVARLASAIEAKRVELSIPGAAVTIATPTQVVMAQGFGMRDVARSLPVTGRTLFAIGSCTKPFTALALALSDDAGVLSLDDHPRRFLPYFALRDSAANAQVNFRDLLSHRTGVPMDDRQGWYERNPTREGLIRFAMSVPPSATFRTKWQYSNFMYVAAGEAMAAAHGARYADVMRRILFEPLGMTATTTSLATVRASSDFSLGYTGRSNARTREAVGLSRLGYLNGIEAAGAIWSNAEDMAHWLRMLAGRGVIDGRRVLSDSNFAAITQPMVRTSGGQYALGWFVEEWHGVTTYSHPGGVTGFGARCEFSPQLGLGWAILTNVDDNTLPKAVRELIYEHLVQPPAAP